MKQYGLIGKSLSHSFSKSYFEEKFMREGTREASYHNYPLGTINEIASLLKNNNFSGLNVTIPYKETIIPFLDELSPNAKAIGAVNTIQFKSGKLIGHNTDYIGFLNSIKPFLESSMERALILGTGGAAKAVIYALKKLGVQCLSVSRSPNSNQLSYADVNELVLKHHLLIVNTTPVGTSPNIDECPSIPYEFISKDHLLVDLIYNPSETLFLKHGKERQAAVLNGKSMLIHQAEEAWKLWNS